MFEEMMSAMADTTRNARALVNGETRVPATISQIQAATKGLLATKKFEEGDAVKCVRKPWGLAFPTVGALAVVVTQDPVYLIADNEPGSCRTAADLGDTLVAVPKISDTGWLIYQVPSGCFELATPAEVASANERMEHDGEELLNAAKASMAKSEN